MMDVGKKRGENVKNFTMKVGINYRPNLRHNFSVSNSRRMRQEVPAKR